MCENTQSWHGQCFVSHFHRLYRDIAVVLTASVAMWKSGVFFFSYLKLETEDQLNLKHGENWIIGSGATVPSVTLRLLVVKTAIPLFHDGMKKLQRCNHLNSE